MSGYKTISDFKGIHEGKRLFILASGPSLNELDLTKLDRRITLGLNRSFMAYTDTDYHCCMDTRLFELYEEEMKKTRYLFTLDDRPWGIPIHLLGTQEFSWDLEEGIYSGYTIAYFSLQVAAYMGFAEIFYLGLDLNHQAGNTHFFGRDFHSRNHETTEFPKMKKMLEYGAEAVKEKGIEVYNCSPVTSLKCFPYMCFEEALKR